jgi:hypothetical protein
MLESRTGLHCAAPSVSQPRSRVLVSRPGMRSQFMISKRANMPYYDDTEVADLERPHCADVEELRACHEKCVNRGAGQLVRAKPDRFCFSKTILYENGKWFTSPRIEHPCYTSGDRVDAGQAKNRNRMPAPLSRRGRASQSGHEETTESAPRASATSNTPQPPPHGRALAGTHRQNTTVAAVSRINRSGVRAADAHLAASRDEALRQASMP